MAGDPTEEPPMIFSSSSDSSDDVAITSEGGMVMDMKMTWGLRYISFRWTIKEFMLREFSSIWIGREVVFLLQNKSWQD